MQLVIVGFLTFSPKVPNKYLLLISLKLYLRVSNPGSLFDIQKHEDFYEKFTEECLEIMKIRLFMGIEKLFSELNEEEMVTRDLLVKKRIFLLKTFMLTNENPQKTC